MSIASRLLAIQKELQASGEEGFGLAGMTVAKTAFGGPELVCTLRKQP